MSKYRFIISLISLIVLTACSSDTQNEKLIKKTNQKEEMISSYKAGVDLINVGDYFAASKKFLEAEILFPQSKWAPKSVLMASYSYFLQGYYTLSIENIKRYLKIYPNDKNKPYAHYLLAMCYYETIEGEKKDLAPLMLSKKELIFLIENYPDTDFAYDARFKIDLIKYQIVRDKLISLFFPEYFQFQFHLKYYFLTQNYLLKLHQYLLQHYLKELIENY